MQSKLSFESNLKDIGKTYKVLIEKDSRKSDADWCGRSSQNKVIVFPKGNYKRGEYVNVFIESVTQGTLIGIVVPTE